MSITEGTTELLVPDSYNKSGPGSRTGEVFYNRQMEFARDISVIFGRSEFREGQRILDGLAATGARGLRLANECGVRAEFVLNDRNLSAAVLMKQNAELNSLGHVQIECRDLRNLLSDAQFDYIDIDPFGTPVDFVDAAIQSCRNGGVIALTATDSAPLYGTYPGTSLRRYGALSQRSPFAHETGLRILLGYVVRQAASHDRAAQPLLGYHSDHYFRAYIRITNGATKADAALKRMGFISYNAKKMERVVEQERPDGKAAGPLWTGPLFSKALLKDLMVTRDLGTWRRCEKIVETWREEVDSPPMFFVLDELARKTKKSPPNLSEFVSYLSNRGHSASRTHFDPKGLKVDLGISKLLGLYKRFPRKTH
ncbi:MAG TPA: tRNA (guanine(26)-N(2))-dimethyltransferase [Thermoplasmata archaeon]|nr:tRNA (guanine(26)-N(2))-dimethyltransferase [Thermoplasmata archaeon]